MANDFYKVMIWDINNINMLDLAFYNCIDGAISITTTKLMQFKSNLYKDTLLSIQITHSKFNKIGGLEAIIDKNGNVDGKIFNIDPSVFGWDEIEREIRKNLR